MAATRMRPQPLHPIIPDSPPELSSSKSSSSSFRSSILTDSAGLENIAHFEDISLSDSKSYDINPRSARPPRPSMRPLHSALGARNKSSAAVDTMRSPHSPQASPFSAHYNDTTPTHKPSPSTGRFNTSRSPSPAKSLNNDLVRSTSGNSIATLGVNGLIRRTSWTPGQRKTVKELEAEYHDSDEDVPDDAVIWNVPISPLVPFVSRTPSPQRKASFVSTSSEEPSPTSDRRPSIPIRFPARKHDDLRRMMTLRRSATTGNLPDAHAEASSVTQRHQSWTRDLSDDARQLSAALEALATKEQIIGNKSPGSPPYALKRAATSVITLPPKQKSNIMIDPLPISKEKEAVLSRTRPSWLPPKSQKEEREHLKQWEKMMALSAVAERKRAAKQLEAMENARLSDESTGREWEDRILPNWKQATREPRTRELWWSGISGKSRGKVWQKAIGNDLHLTTASYTVALQRSPPASESAVVSSIEAEAPTAFPETGLFATAGPLGPALTNVLKAYAAYRPDIGYAPGLHRIAALLLLHMSEPEAFVSLANLLNRPLPLAFLTRDRAGTDKWVSLALSTVAVKLPALHEHLTKLPCPADFVTPVLGSLFAAHLDLDALSRVWDVYVFEHDRLLVRAYAGLLSRVEARLYGGRDEVLSVLAQGWRGQDVESVMRDVREAGKAGPHVAAR